MGESSEKTDARGKTPAQAGDIIPFDRTGAVYFTPDFNGFIKITFAVCTQKHDVVDEVRHGVRCRPIEGWPPVISHPARPFGALVVAVGTRPAGASPDL